MKTLILAAGFAERLEPLTLSRPKQLLEIGDRLMFDYLMDTVRAFHRDAREGYPVFIVVNSKFAGQFRAWAKIQDLPIHILENGVMEKSKRLGAVGDFVFALNHVFPDGVDDDLLVLAGDNLYEFSLSEMHSQYLSKGSTIAVHDLQDPKRLAKRFGVVECDSSLRVIGFEEKPEVPKTSLAATVVYMLRQDDLARLRAEYLSRQDTPDNIGLLVKWLSENGTLYAWPSKDLWVDIGSLDELKRVRDLFIQRASQA